MPRMTNTYMLAGTEDPKTIVASVKRGVYAVSFGGGQVDITSGKYVFQCTEAYMIEDGRIAAPIKGAMLIGNGPTDLKRVTMVGNDLELDHGVGNCGKNGQWVPVGVGQPTLRMVGITVGGTENRPRPDPRPRSSRLAWPMLKRWGTRARNPDATREHHRAACCGGDLCAALQADRPRFGAGLSGGGADNRSVRPPVLSRPA
jgi:hypothetical protein